MSYTLIRDCVVLLYYKDRGYRFDALSDFQFSQTFSRNTIQRKTLFSKVAKPVTLANTRNPGSFSMTVLATNTFNEGVFFELAGMTTPGTGRYTFPDKLAVSPEFCELFVLHENNIFRMSRAALQSIDVSLTLNSSLGFSVAFTGGELERVRSLPLASGVLEQGAPIKPSPIQFYMQNRLFSNIINAGLNIQQQINWRNDRSLHDIGRIYSNTKAVLTEANLTTAITTHLNNRVKTSDEPFISDIAIQKSNFRLSMENCLVIKRFTPEDIFQESFDIALTEQTDKIFVDYGGLIT